MRHLPIPILGLLFASVCQQQQPSQSPAATIPASARRIAAEKPSWNARLLLAAKTGDDAGTREALRHGASPNARGFYDMSPLLWAVSQHHYTTATLLLDRGANPNQPKKDRVTPICIQRRMETCRSRLCLSSEVRT